MHKGYAFVQFTNPFDARSACMGEDGRGVFGQILDVNLVAEPKPHQIGRKRPNVAKTGGDCYNAGGAMGPCGPRLTPPLKRPRLMVPNLRQQPRAQSPKKVATPGLEDLKTYSGAQLASKAKNKVASVRNNKNQVREDSKMSITNTSIKETSSPDILICGNCRELFSNLSDFIEHRRTYCKLRFTCKCSSHNGTMQESALLLCALCKENFASAWDLMVHAQAAHMVNIYQLGSKDTLQDSGTCSTAEESTAGTPASELGGDISTETNGGEASGDPAERTKSEDDARPPLPKQNGVGGEDEGEGSSEMMNGASPLPQHVDMEQGEALVTQ